MTNTIIQFITNSTGKNKTLGDRKHRCDHRILYYSQKRVDYVNCFIVCDKRISCRVNVIGYWTNFLQSVRKSRGVKIWSEYIEKLTWNQYYSYLIIQIYSVVTPLFHFKTSIKMTIKFEIVWNFHSLMWQFSNVSMEYTDTSEKWLD